MDMENILHLYLCKLRIISKIPIGGKLDISHNDINIYYGGIVGWMLRKAYGDNKDNAAKYLIDLYKEINSFSDQLMYNIDNENNSITNHKKINMLLSLTEKLKESLTGIRNLIGTYKQYLKVISLLECLEQDVIIPQYRTLLKFIPKQYYTDILKSPITHAHVHTLGIAKLFTTQDTNSFDFFKEKTLEQKTLEQKTFKEKPQTSDPQNHDFKINRSSEISIPNTFQKNNNKYVPKIGCAKSAPINIPNRFL